MSRFSAKTATVAVVALLASACSGDVPLQAGSSSPSTDNVCGAAKPGTQAVVYSAPGLEYWYSDVLTTFQQDCGVSIYYGSFSGPEVLQRLGDERSAPLSDIVIAQPPYITQAADQGLLDSGAVPGADSVPADRCDAQRRWCTMVESYTSWVYRKTRAPAPVTWTDILARAYAGKILTSRPDQTVDGFAALELLTQTQGAGAAIAYLEQLEASVSAHYTNTDTISRLVSTGVALVGNGNLQENLNDLDQFHNIGVWFPRATDQAPSTLAVPYGAALVKGGPNRATATALLTYMWSRAGQLAVGGANVAPGRPDVTPSDSRSRRLRSTLGTIHVIRVDWEQVVVQQPQLLARWTAIARAPDGTAAPSSPTPSAALPPPPPASSASPSH